VKFLDHPVYPAKCMTVQVYFSRVTMYDIYKKNTDDADALTQQGD